MHPELAPGSDDGFAQESKSPHFFQSQGEINFFAGEKLVIESADGAKIFASGEQERARAELRERKIEEREDLNEHASPQRHRTLGNHPRSTTGKARFECTDSRSHVTGRNRRVRI